ncbi:MAG: heavy metal translocating P-type ATPase metal-binding domain-containing protein [Phycisphaerales bacterium]
MKVTEHASDVSCAHCSLPVPRGLLREDRAEQFCCSACAMAYEMIRSCGMEGYYDVAEKTGATRERARGKGKRYDDLDAAAQITIDDDGRATTELSVKGMHCAACVWLLERLPRMCAGVVEARVSMPRARVALAWDPNRTELSSIARTIDALGYECFPYYAGLGTAARRKERDRYLVRIGVAGAIAGNIMLASVALYAGEFVGIEPLFEQLFRWVSLGLTVVLLAWPGATFFRGAIAALRTRTPHIDMPVSLGLLVGGVAGAWNTVRGAGDIYFDSISALTFFLLIGRWLQAQQQERAFDAVAMTDALTPRTARVVRGGEVFELPVEEVRPDECVEVRAGETVPVDGLVDEGASDLDRSVMTGESMPVAVDVGDSIHAGDVNLTARLLVRVKSAGRETRLSHLMERVEEAMDRRAPIQVLANRVAGVFVVVVLVLSTLTFSGWMVFDPTLAVPTTVALLIVTCPCALGLATPLTVATGLGRAARRGVFIKGGDVLERMAGVGDIVFDKTGTLTEGRCTLTAWYGDEALRQPVARAEAMCDHPVARALSEGLNRDCEAPVELSHTAGRGVVAVVDGMLLTIGSERFLREQGVAPPNAHQRAILDDITARAESPVLVARGGTIEAIAAIGDAIRPEVPELIRTLESRGWTAHVLSGDVQDVVNAVALRAGIDTAHAIGGADPEHKAMALRRLAKRGTVIMVGDGVNDAAALAEATVGIAVSGGAEASLTAADVFLAGAGIDEIPRTLEGARLVTRTIRTTVAFSVTYNALCATLAIAGFITPLLAAILMPASSLTVLTLARANRSFV